MKRLVFLLLVIFVYSCNKDKKKTVQLNENESIEVYNFKQLEPLLYTDDNAIHVVNFWATWCAPCIKEIPYFQELHDTYDKNSIKVMLVSLDFTDKLESQLIPFIKRKNLTPQVILLDDPDENNWIPKVDKSWSGAIPATLIYTKNKRAFYEQSFTKESLFKEIEKFKKFRKL